MATDTTSIVFASSNAGKVRELDALLAPLGYSVIAQGDLGVSDAEETATTFVENALLKARHACRETGRPAIADDSGLEVDALNGAPGLYSARYAERAGRGSGDAANNALLLEQLVEHTGEQARRARFRTVVVRLRHVDDPSPLIASAAWEGHVLKALDGEGGFGYDPLFCNHDTRESAARLDAATKNRLSHRGKAVAELVRLLRAEQ
jgi:XTP/dITP diphosphohydrolase